MLMSHVQTLSQQQRTSHTPVVRSQGHEPNGWNTWFGMTVLLSKVTQFRFQSVSALSKCHIMILNLFMTWSSIWRKQLGMYDGLNQQRCLRGAPNTSRHLEGFQDTQRPWTAVRVCSILRTQRQTSIQSQVDSHYSLGHKRKQVWNDPVLKFELKKSV